MRCSNNSSSQTAGALASQGPALSVTLGNRKIGLAIEGSRAGVLEHGGWRRDERYGPATHTRQLAVI